MSPKQLASIITRAWEIRQASFVLSPKPESCSGKYTKTERDAKMEAFKECRDADPTLEKEFISIIWCLDIGFNEVNDWVIAINAGRNPVTD